MQPIDHEADPLALRSALGQYATGVTVITVATPRGPLGMTANSFTSVSLDPPLLLWCPACSSMRHDAMAGAERFALHVLGEDQADLARAFSRSGEAFDGFAWHEGEDGLPFLDGCAARFTCRTENRMPAGDHTIILGRIEKAETNSRPGLVFSQGHYGRFTAS